MNTITQIENALKAIDQAKFQTLVNHLLYLQGNKFIGAPGAVVGKEKTSKGTPDSFFVDGDKYIFVECTTQEKIGEAKSFFQKLSKDIDHCFDEGKTAIPKEKVAKVVLACNEKITAEEYRLLDTKVKTYHPEAEIEVLNIQNLPILINEFPKLADGYLGIPILKGDIYPLEEFLLKTKTGLQPSLTNEFIGREEEIKNGIAALKKHDILLLSGGAGVGKSKLAVKILDELSKVDYIPIVIQSSGVPLWEDYRHLFLPGKQYIILFDDANKSVNNLNYLLSKLRESKSYAAKLVITSRDYVKKQVSAALGDWSYQEFNIPEFKDAEIENIIIAALPNLQYHREIKQKIVDLAKGNVRVALMATYSVTPDSEKNYLDSPVMLYEKYFKKISEEIGILDNAIVLQSLAIVSFFSVLDRNNEKLKADIEDKFGIDWNELWSAILELHNNELVDVYADEIVKVSDQVLSTYAFYKCFIDDQTAVINYGDWIATFIEKHSNRIRITLVDVNNTFTYHHIKELVLPHLNKVSEQIISDEERQYAFYDLFWIYKDLDCLLYLRKWIMSLPQEEHPGSLNFDTVNSLQPETRHFGLLKRFWNHPNEYLNPSLKLTFELAERQPSLLPEISKSINEDFKYKIEDLEHRYLRQNMLFDVLLDDKWNDTQKTIVNGIFLRLSDVLLGWHYTQYGPTKGHEFTYYNFNLYKSEALSYLRMRILAQLYDLFEIDNKQCAKVLMKIVHPGGDIDKSLYAEELPIYEKIISHKLDHRQSSHCKFVSSLSEHLEKVATAIPESWNDFINSDIQKLSDLLKPDWKDRKSKSLEERPKERLNKINDVVNGSDWPDLEQLLLNVNSLYDQEQGNSAKYMQAPATNIYIAIARKDKAQFENALRLHFSGKVHFPLSSLVFHIPLQEEIITGEELFRIVDSYEFEDRFFWESVLVTSLPEQQINEHFLKLLLALFNNGNRSVNVHNMHDYLKYWMAFENYKAKAPELGNHNIITYLASLILARKNQTSNPFGYDFFSECASYFSNHIEQLKSAYWAQHEIDPGFDYEDKELRAMLDLDRHFIHETFSNGAIGLGYTAKINLSNINISLLWEYPEYEELVENLLFDVVEKERFSSTYEQAIFNLFRLKSADENSMKKVKSLIIKLTQKYAQNDKVLLILIETVYNNYNDWIIPYYRDFLLLRKDIEITKKNDFGRSGSMSGSWVPVYQRRIDFYQSIINMINTLPDILDYAEHIAYFEQLIAWKKEDIKKEMKRDFMEEHY
ncbi:nSTAND3 domain-containing NTPase [Sphingobacterium bovistauri]|uniref:Novel STAND NTPase 3 domain-containing protein n=1 Tax=Sphingobacterium bovistauri TaxID=2781959 RepID=A0ABS7Z664_9SPHI|nr:hypothetical protein [Sphingobacterium bovistauri]MCA5005645.1 hypothetical protein [Sphingobacterium bovistauri]